MACLCTPTPAPRPLHPTPPLDSAVLVCAVPTKRRVLRQWERGHAASAASSGGQEEGEGEGQEKKASPLFDDFSDDETFQYTSDSEPAPRQWAGDSSPPPGPRTPSTTPPYSPESISSPGEGPGGEAHTPVTPTEPEGKSLWHNGRLCCEGY